MLFLNLFSFLMRSFLSYCVEIFMIAAILLGKFLWSKRSKYELADGLPGPKSLPIIGNALTFWCRDEDIFERLVECIAKYPSPMRFWNGLKLCVVFRDPNQVEKIFSSTAFATKDDIYKFIKFFSGEGLISGSGAKWKKDRRLMSPLFLKRNILQYYPVIIKHTRILVDILEEKVEGATLDIGHYLHRAVTDFVNESIIGIKSNAQAGELDEFILNMNRSYEYVHRRMIKPWLQIDFLYRFTKSYREQLAMRRVIHGFFTQVLERAKGTHSHLGQKDDATRTILEQMLDIRDEVPDFATDEQMIHHLTTLYTASGDTITTICAFALVVLGMYPHYQQKVVDEISNVVGLDRDVQGDQFGKLEYLEMVLKETLRLFPIGPFILREASQDVEIEGWKISKGMSVTISIHNIHRDPGQWEKPDEFYPEHFLPQAIKKRHPYAYIPFSAGVRSCLGKPYAYLAMKIVLVSLLQKYTIEADGTLQDRPLTTDISVRFKDKMYPIRIRKRQ